jgi:hypothetical protein
MTPNCSLEPSAVARCGSSRAFAAGTEGQNSTERRLPETAFSIFHIKWDTTGRSCDSSLVLPKRLELIRGHLGIAHGVLNVPVPKVVLDRSRVVVVVR